MNADSYTVTVAGAERKKVILLGRAIAQALKVDDFQNVTATAINLTKVNGQPLLVIQNMRENAKIEVLVTFPGAEKPDDDFSIDEDTDMLNTHMRQAQALLDLLDDTEATTADAVKLYRMLEEVAAAHTRFKLIEPVSAITFQRRGRART